MRYLQQYTTHAMAAMLLAFAISSSSCNKLIEIPSHPNDKLSTDRVFSDSVDIMSALVGIYTDMHTSGYGGYIFSSDLTLYTGMSSDELVYTYPNNSDFSDNNLHADHAEVETLWATAYAGIYQCNAFLEGVTGNTAISPELQSQVRGEGLFTRALYYFELVNLYGGVPMITGTDFTTNARKPRASADSIYALIISDLTTALSLLQEKYPSAGHLRPNKHTAEALMARVDLYRGQWRQAADLSSQIIGSGLYQLVDPLNVYYDGSKEAIWQMPYTTNNGQTADANYLLSSYGNQPVYGLTDVLMNAFEPGDLRQTSWTGSVTINGITYNYAAKYKNSYNGTPIEDYMFFRLAEQHLIRAEALAHLDQLDSARTDINTIRARAGLGATTAITKEEVLTAIEHERQVELFCELGHRWYDLKRTGRVADVLSAEKATGWQPTDALYPVPLPEMQSNPFLTQNPGYN
jgi:hypothetical protein